MLEGEDMREATAATVCHVSSLFQPYCVNTDSQNQAWTSATNEKFKYTPASMSLMLSGQV